MNQRFELLPGRIDAGLDHEWATRRRRFRRFVNAVSFAGGIVLGQIAYHLIGKHF